MTEQGQDSRGREIRVRDRVRWRGEIYTIKAFGEADGRFGTRSITFEEPLHATDELPDEFAVDLVQPSPRIRCRWCGEDCPRWGSDICPFRPRQIPRDLNSAPVMWKKSVMLRTLTREEVEREDRLWSRIRNISKKLQLSAIDTTPKKEEP